MAKRYRVFSVDAIALRTTIEELCEALDVVGFTRPLELFTNDESALCAWLHEASDADADPNTVQQEFVQQVEGLRALCKQRATSPTMAAKASHLIDMALREGAEAFTLEELD